MNARKGGLVALLLATSLIGSVSHAFADDTTFGGFGYGCKVDTSLTGVVLFGFSGYVPSTGGVKERSLLRASINNLLDANVLHGSVCASHGRVESLAGAANIHLFPGLLYSLDVGVATSEARTSSTGSNGRSQILNLKFGGKDVVVTGEANQRVSIPGVATLVINEQKFFHDGNVRRVRINALRLTVVGVGEVVISAAEADLNFVTSSNGPCFDFLSGCGRLVDASNHLLDFSVNIGINDGLSIIAHDGCFANANIRVRLTGCTKYRNNNGARHCEGPCEINGVSGFTYVLDCLDGGDTPSNDLCHLHLSNGLDFSGHCSIGQIKLNIPCGSLALNL